MRTLFSVLLFFSLTSSLLEASSGQKTLTQRLNSIFKNKKLKNTKISVDVTSLKTSEELYSMNRDLALSPASSIKVLTAWVALNKFGPEHVFYTQIYTSGLLKNGVLEGDLYLKGGGDPSLVSERMHLLAEEIYTKGIHSITGNIYVDESYFDSEYFDPNRIKSDKQRAYNSPINGLSFNYNTITVSYAPTSPGKKLKVNVVPNTGYVKLENTANTSSSKSKYSLQASRIKQDGHDLIRISKNFPSRFKGKKQYFSATQPDVFAGRALKYYLNQFGVSILGGVQKKRAPSSANKFLKFPSLALREIVVLMNKYSSNFIADTLVKHLGKSFGSSGPQTASGLSVLKNELLKNGITGAESAEIFSGSGLTRINKISSATLTSIFLKAHKKFVVFPELMASLPLAAKDGTLKSRMKGTTAERVLRAKTGTISGVIALAGVVRSQGGELLAFSVLMNDNSSEPASSLPWHNRLGEALANFNRNTEVNK